MWLWFTIAERLGGRTVEEWQQVMTSAEFTLWRAYHKQFPFGYDIDNFRMGSICSAVVNMAPRGKNAKPVKPADFYPSQPKPKKALTQRQLEQLDKKRRKQNG